MVSKINHYEIKEMLGRGGMGSVYKAYDTLLDRYVAMKFLLPELNQDAQFLKRFNNEAKLLARLNHPNIATLYNLIHFENQWIMIMEYVDGLNLDQYLQQYPKGLALDSVVKILQGVSHGLSYAHSLGVIHRDIKPGNIMVSKSGRIKLMDFGIALSHQMERHTKAGNIIGSIPYLAPELIKGKSPTVQTDMYALGIVTYELLTGSLPFNGTNEYAIMEKHLKQALPKLNKIFPGYIRNIVKKCTQKNPQNRYNSVGAISSHLPDNPKSKKISLELPIIILPKLNINPSSIFKLINQSIRLDKYNLLGLGILIIGLIGVYSFSSKKKSTPLSPEPFYEYPRTVLSKESDLNTYELDPILTTENGSDWKQTAQNLFTTKLFFPPGANLLDLCRDKLKQDSTDIVALNFLNRMILTLLTEGDKIGEISKKDALAVYQKVLLIDSNYTIALNRIERINSELKPDLSQDTKIEVKEVVKTPKKSDRQKTTSIPIKPKNTFNQSHDDTALTKMSPNKEIQQDDTVETIVNRSHTVEAFVPYNKKVTLFLVESINSEQPRSSGDRIEVRIKEAVYEGDEILFNAYAKVRAYLKRFRPSLNNKKGLIELVIQQAQAYDGSWVNIHRATFRIPGKKGERIEILKDVELEVYTSESKIISYQKNR